MPGTPVKDRLMLLGSCTTLVVAAVLVAWQIFGGPPSAATQSRLRDVVCIETGAAFQDWPLPEGLDFPYINPKTGKRTLYPAERCYWNRDGTAKLTPTLVVVNEARGLTGPTLCPDCGRRVIFHNNAPPMHVMVEAAEREGKIKPQPPPTPK